MKASSRLTQLINSFESFRDVAYWDGTYVDEARAQKRWSIGWGTTVYPDGNLVKEHDTCTRAQADTWRDADIVSTAEAVHGYLYLVAPDWDADPVTNQDKFDACVDFAYNAGDDAFRQSTLRRLVDDGDPAAADEFLKWTMAGGVRVNGLLRRRLAERALFLSDFKPDGSLKTAKEDFPDAKWYPAT